MAPATINPDPSSVHLDGICPEGDTITLVLRTHRPAVDCPVCGCRTDRIHRWYQRTLADLPWHDLAVRLTLHTRRWRCQNPGCPRQIFTERLPTLVAPSARRTNRLTTVVEAVVLALGGEAGTRLLAVLGVTLSPDTLLNRLRDGTPPTHDPLRVIGLDDWSWRRGHRYGAIVVDLERHRVAELLPDRKPATIAAWLQQHPEIAVIARDRGDAMVAAATTGAPQALQVADRWHLLHNLVELLEGWLLQQRSLLRQAAAALHPATDAAETALPVDAPGPLTPARPHTAHQRAEEVSQARHARIVEQYAAIQRLHAAGAAVADIARTVGVSRRTVYRYRALPQPPERKPPRSRQTRLTPFIPTLLTRWADGCHNASRLWRDLQAAGCTASASTVARFVAQLRRDEAAGQPAGTTHRRRVIRAPSPRQVAHLLVQRPDLRTTDQSAFLEQLRQTDATMATVLPLVEVFASMVRERQHERLDAWREQVEQTACAPLRRFARGLEPDLEAVRAGLREAWSNGQTEGQIHRLKLLKRQGYGRTGFAVLRRRVLQTA